MVLKRIRKLGQGAFGTTYLVKDENNQLTCVKEIKLSGLNQSQMSYIKDEIQIMSKLSHINITHLISSRWLPQVAILQMQYAESGDLSSYLQRNIINNEQRLDILLQAAVGVLYLQTQHIIHRDIKPANILVQVVDGKPIYKICDFGLSKSLASTYGKAKSIVGTPMFMAPELILGQQYTGKVDVWSLGILAYYVFEGHLPFIGTQMADLYRGIIKLPPFPFKVLKDQRITALILSMLVKDPKQRPSISEILCESVLRETMKEYCSFLSTKQLSQELLLLSQFVPQVPEVNNIVMQQKSLWDVKYPLIKETNYPKYYQQLFDIACGKSLMNLMQKHGTSDQLAVDYYKVIWKLLDDI